MITEKTPTLYLKKISSDCDKANGKFCTRNTLSWFFAVILVTLVVVLTVQFFYPTFYLRFSAKDNGIRLADGTAFDVSVFPSGYPVNNKELSAWDLNFLLDPVNLCITRNPPNSHQYEQDPEVQLLMLVPSAVDHFEQRRAIRKTWGSVAERPLGPMRLGFVLGTTDDKAVTNRVQEESARHGDVIQADFADSRQTTKSVLMLKWVAERCPHAQYFLKAEDDTFVNVGVVADILGSEPFASQKKFIGGNIHAGTHQTPQVGSYVYEYDSPLDEYPAYVSGSVYVMTGPVAVELFDASREVEPVLAPEDVFLTGLCADHIGVPRIHDARFALEDLLPGPPTWDALSSLASAPSVTPDTLEAVWKDLSQSSLSLVSLFFNQEAAINSTVVVRLKRNF